MVGYSFDDFEKWIHPYPPDVYVSQMERLVCRWRGGLAVLSKLCGTPKTDELYLYAEVAYIHFYTDLLQTRFALYKREGNIVGMRECMTDEKANAERLLTLMKKDAKIGYETSNHYFYTERSLIEKVIRMEKFLLMTEDNAK